MTHDEEGVALKDEKAAFEALIHDENNDVKAIAEPTKFFQAMRGPQAEHWKAAMKEELESHKQNGTWEAKASHSRPLTLRNLVSTHPWRECSSPPRPSGKWLPWAEGLQAVSSN